MTNLKREDSINVLIDTRHLKTEQTSGVGEYTKKIIDSLNKKINTTQTHVPFSNKLFNFSTFLFNKPDITKLTSEPVGLLFMPNLNFAAVPKNTPFVLTVHDLSWFFFPDFYSYKMRLWHKMVKPKKLINRANAIITPSLSTKQDLISIFKKPSEKIHIVPHGIHQSFCTHQNEFDQKLHRRHELPKRFALFVGTLEPRKNLVALIEAIQSYRKNSNDDLNLVLSGNWGWNDRSIRKKIKNKNWIHRLGYIPSEYRPALYRSATVTVWPSVYEGFGLPPLESMACGTPVITSFTSSLPEIVQNNAVLIDPYNPGDIQTALEQLLSSPTLMKEMSQKGLQNTQKYSWEKAARSTIEVFNSVL